jgi:AraC-like DNA-binding protein
MNSKKILIVEDSIENVHYATTILNKVGFEVVTGIDSYNKAILILEKEQFLLVILDINLSRGKDGVDIGNYLLAKDNVPFIYVSSCTKNDILERVKDSRPHGFIVKPYKALDLTTTVSIVINNYRYKRIDTKRTLTTISNEAVPYKLKQVIQYINNNLDKRIEVATLVAITNWEERNFRNLFLKCLLVTPYQYILARKIEKALILLTETKIPLNEVAFELGFTSYSNFFEAFKKVMHQTPEFYRNNRDFI